MIKSTKWLSILACLTLLVPLEAPAQSGATSKRPQELNIAAMRAMLFYETTGTFSADVFTSPVNLWNTMIEGAARDGASESMLVVVEVKAEGDRWATAGNRVQLTARYRIADVSGYGKPAVVSRIMSINIGSDQKFFAGFWLYETGCHPVQLTARIVGQKRRLRKTINLRCGE